MNRIIEQLNRVREISDWRIIRNETTGYQMYVINDILDNVRKVRTDRYVVTVYCDHGEFRGSTDLTVFDYQLDGDGLAKRLEEAVFIANRVNNVRYELPAVRNEYPFVETFDPTLLGDVREILFVKLADRLIDLVEAEPGVRLSSSEYFLDLHEIQVVNSRGLDIRYRKSDIFFDGVLLSGEGESETEVHFEPRARRLQDLPMEVIVPQYARYARDSANALLPRSGRYPVVVSGDALTPVFGPIIHQSSGAAIYSGSSGFKAGEPVCGERECKGEPLTIISNGFIPFGLRTAPADADGVAADRFELIREGIFQKPWTTNQYAQYLNTEPTGTIGNLEVPIGPVSVSGLLTDDQPVLHIVSFAALMPDMVSGNFSAEIRLGYEIYKDQIKPVKGGSVSGNLIRGFDNAHFSTEAQTAAYALSLDRFGTYVGPRAVRFEGFQISGE